MLCPDKDMQRPGIRIHPMLNGVLHDGLQGERRQAELGIRSTESVEEANYNMVDGLHNNRKKRKKKKRKSVLKRLHEKQMEVAKREKRVPYQDLPQFMQEHEIERKSNN